MGLYIAEEWLALERDVLGKRPLISGTVAEVRAGYAETSKQLASLYPDAATYDVRDVRETTASGVAIRVYTPTGVSIPDTGFPVCIFAHGGGHVNGGAWSSSFEDRMCRYIAHYAHVVVAQPDFRLAPEHPVPAQIEDTFDAYKWCYENAPKLHGDPARFISAGSSLGGGVAVGVAMKLIDENFIHMVKGIAVLAPALLHPEFVPKQYQSMFKAYEETWTGAPLQDGQSMLLFYGYNGSTAQRTNPYVFPILHPGLSRLPPVYQAVCDADPVRDDSVIFKHILDQHGIRNKIDRWPGMPHYFWLFPQLKSSEKFHAQVAEGVKWVVSQMTIEL